jgi:hypothetical protein
LYNNIKYFRNIPSTILPSIPPNYRHFRNKTNNHVEKSLVHAYLLTDSILDDCGSEHLHQALLGEQAYETEDGLLAALGAGAIQLLVVVDHLLEPALRACMFTSHASQQKMQDKKL